MALAKNIFRKGRGLGRGGSIIGPDSRLADDGKRLDSKSRAGSCVCGGSKKKSLDRGGGLEGEGSRFASDGGWRMTGSA